MKKPKQIPIDQPFSKVDRSNQTETKEKIQQKSKSEREYMAYIHRRKKRS